MCSLYANSGAQPREEFVMQLRGDSRRVAETVSEATVERIGLGINSAGEELRLTDGAANF